MCKNITLLLSLKPRPVWVDNAQVQFIKGKMRKNKCGVKFLHLNNSGYSVYYLRSLTMVNYISFSLLLCTVIRD